MLRGPRRIANQVILLALGLELFSIGLWGTLTYLGSRNELVHTISQQLNEAAYRTQSKIGDFLTPLTIHTRLAVDMLSGRDAPAGVLPEPLLRRLVRTQQEVKEVSLIGADRKEKIRISSHHSYDKTDLRDLSADPLVSTAFLGETRSGDISFAVQSQPQLRIATPVVSGNHVTEVLLTVVDLRWLWDVIRAQHVGDTGYVYVVDSRLKLIAPLEPGLVAAGTTLDHAQVPRELFIAQTMDTYLVYPSLTGGKVAGISRFDPVNNWWVVVEQPVKEGLAPLDRIVERLILILVFAVPVTITLVVLFSHIIMAPLRAFEEGVERIANGERNVQVDVPKNSNLAGLTVDFNRMAASLDHQIAELIASERALRQSEDRYRALSESLRQRVEEATEQLRESNQRLAHTAAEAERANHAKSYFLANMSHELRTPLNAIIGYGEMLREEAQLNDMPRIIPDLERIMLAANHLLGLINDVLDLSKVEAGKMELLVEDIEIAYLVADVADTVLPLAARNNNTFTASCAPDIGVIRVDAIKLRQCLINLLGNACKFTHNGTVTFTVRIAPDDTRFIELAVVDTGIGMSEEQQNRVFEAFSQADASTTRKYGGTGLGLTISKRFCEMMGGDIHLTSKPNEGTNFTIRLPRQLDVARLTAAGITVKIV